MVGSDPCRVGHRQTDQVSTDLESTDPGATSLGSTNLEFLGQTSISQASVDKALVDGVFINQASSDGRFADPSTHKNEQSAASTPPLDRPSGDLSPATGLPDHLLSQVGKVEELIGYCFKDKALALQAITHPSATGYPYLENSYERLEFLGDSYLGAIVSELLFREFPDLDEGGMTRMKIVLVSGDTLSAKAAELGLADAIVFGSSEQGTGKRGLHSALENVFESLIAAVVLDGGIDAAKKWVIPALRDAIHPELAIRPENPKSQLQELLQERQITPTYELVSADGPAHARVFTARVMAGDKVLAEGTGHSIKEAEMQAAALAMQQMG